MTAGGAGPTVIVVAKEPRPGHVKTRLCPPCTPTEAARLAEAALADTLRAVASSSASRRLVALDGRPGPWLAPGFDVVQQRGADLADRLAAAFDDAGGPALLVGMDTPQVTPDLLDAALALLAGGGSVLGLALDGGFWAIGLACADRRVFEDVPMSTPATGPAQHDRLVDLGLTPRDLPVLRDVDHFDDALAVSAEAPGTAFAAAVRSLSIGLSGGVRAERPSGATGIRDGAAAR